MGRKGILNPGIKVQIVRNTYISKAALLSVPAEGGDMKKEMRKISFFIVLVVAILFVQTAVATTTTLLPPSSHYQGRSYFRTLTSDGFLSGRIEYAVYDTEVPTELSEFKGSGRYTYVYQIFNDGDDTASPLEYFAIFGIGEGAIFDMATDIGSVDDNSGGINSSAMYFGVHDANTGPDNAVWEFEADNSLVIDAHSFFLIISSNYDYTKGTYSVTKSSSPYIPLPGDAHTPEPGTLALLGVGSMVTLLRRRRTV